MKLKRKLTGSSLSLIFVTIILVFLLHSLQTSAQYGGPPASYQALKIGDKVPDIAITTSTGAKIKISDYAGQLVILDFWATWCSACIENFQEMDSLQKSSGGKMRVILVNTKSTGDTEEKVRQFFEKEKKNGNTYQFTSVVMDTVLTKLFPHKLLPHYAWIGPDGIVKATTAPDQLSAENINSVLNNLKAAMTQKIDMDKSRPLFSGDNLSVDDVVYYSVFKKGHIEGLGGGNTPRKSGKILRGIALTNVPILSMYRIALYGLYPGYTNKRMVIEVLDSSKLFPEKSTLSKAEWYHQNEFNYDIIIPVSQASDLHSRMLNELNNYSGYYGRTESRMVPCLVLNLLGKGDKIATKGGTPVNRLTREGSRTLINMPASALARWLNGEIDLYWLIDGTNYKGNIDINFPDGLSTIDDFNKVLKSYGLQLRREDRVMDVFVLSEKPE